MLTRINVGLAVLLFFGVGAISSAAHAQNIAACPTTISAPGTYTVTANLAATGTCITIAALSDVAIDLHGHTITGSGTGSGIVDNGCFGSQQNNIIIANGTITGFSGGSGIDLTCTSYATISKINANQNLYGISLENDYHTITDSQVNDNVGGGISFTISSGSTVINTQANSNGGAGIETDLGGSNTVINSQANNNAAGGIVFVKGGSNAVISSSVNNNEGNGIYSYTGGDTISHNQVNGNTSSGIWSFGGFDNIISNSANNNGSYGIYSYDGNDTISHNQVNGNANYGIWTLGDANLLTDNIANHNGGGGIGLACPSNLFLNLALGNPAGNNIVTSGPDSCARLDNNPAP